MTGVGRLDRAGFRRRRAAWEKAWGVSFEAAFFDHRGELVPEPGARPLKGQGVLTKYWRILRSYEKRQVEAVLPAVTKLFGPKWEEAPAARGTAMEFRGTGDPGFLFWDIDPCTDGGGFLFLVWRQPTLLGTLGRRIRAAGDRFPYAVLVRTGGGPLTDLSPVPLPPADLARWFGGDLPDGLAERQPAPEIRSRGAGNRVRGKDAGRR
ncbi:MAG: hypothetical protein GX442_08925 [Candidatus Riflebacteria bacterium]|nr:hypothetical protein [Candidatus Riflebacteria bacterium]